MQWTSQADRTGGPQLYTRAMLEQTPTADTGRSRQGVRRISQCRQLFADPLCAGRGRTDDRGGASGLPRLGAFYTGRIVNALAGLLLLGAALTGRLRPQSPAGSRPAADLRLSDRVALTRCDHQRAGLPRAGAGVARRVRRTDRARSIALVTTAPLLALCKGVYLPLMAAGLRLPDSRADRRPWLLIAR